jgi:CheY-like chemotaxis protein
MYLPLSAEKARAGRPVERGVLSGTETILVGEDEDALRKIAAEFLKTMGYRVITAKNGEEALALFRESSGEIDLVLMDIAMPGMGGLDVYHEIKKIKPDIAALFMTGYSLETSGLGAVQKQGISAIRKPFTMAGLDRKIREMLETGDR